MMKLETMIAGAWAGEQLLVVSGTGVTIGENLFEGYSWTMAVVLINTVGVGLLSCVCGVRSVLANRKCTCDKRTRGCTTARWHDFEKHAKQDHQPRRRDDVESLMVFWRSAAAADEVECTVWSRYTGTVLAARCWHE